VMRPEVSRAVALRPVAGGGLGCLTRGGRGEGSRVGLSWEAGPKGRKQLGRRAKIKGEKNKLPKPFGPKTKLENKWATDFFFKFSTKT
jgi:hypothetical protein